MHLLEGRSSTCEFALRTYVYLVVDVFTFFSSSYSFFFFLSSFYFSSFKISRFTCFHARHELIENNTENNFITLRSRNDISWAINNNPELSTLIPTYEWWIQYHQFVKLRTSNRSNFFRLTFFFILTEREWNYRCSINLNGFVCNHFLLKLQGEEATEVYLNKKNQKKFKLGNN